MIRTISLVRFAILDVLGGSTVLLYSKLDMKASRGGCNPTANAYSRHPEVNLRCDGLSKCLRKALSSVLLGTFVFGGLFPAKSVMLWRFGSSAR